MTTVASETVVPPERGVASGREFIFLVTALMATGAIAIDLMLPTFPEMRTEFGMASDSAELGWIITSFFLGLAVGPWLYGPVSDRVGRRAPLFIGLGLYTVSAIAASLAPSFGWIVAVRFVWGLGAAAPRSLSLAMIRDRYEGAAMARLMSMIMAVFLLVPIVAPGLGALLNLVAPWRIVFWTPAVAAIALMFWSRRLPETLPPERRRPFTLTSVMAAGRIVLTNRQTMSFTIAITFLFGVMMSYLASSELIVEDVYGYGKWFPVFFGCIAVLLAVSSLNNARLVGVLGVKRLVRQMAAIGVVVALILTVISIVTDGVPNFWLFSVVVALLIPMAQGLVPNCNTAAMMPVPHVAGTASAIIGTVSTAGGALLGGFVNGAFDGTVQPFAFGVTAYVVVAAVFVFIGSSGAEAPELQASRPPATMRSESG